MNYISTRDNSVRATASKAITQGISNEGGLFVPESFPQISLDKIASLSKKSYIDRACDILSGYLSDFSSEEIRNCVEGAYADGKFEDEKIAPLSKLSDSAYILELWHGPTCAFKDMALQLLPYLLTTSAKKNISGKKIVILVATSGDTGKAALEGFKNVEGTEIIVFYPQDGVSTMQKLQMQTQEGSNVSVCGIYGNFDDAQNGVKAIFTNKEIAEKLSQNNMMFSSANSINWGRLVPQIVYYISAYCDLLNDEEIALGDKINIVVPTGNFGNILAAYYAKKMGLPINKLICASNKNNVLTDFINSGTYDRNRLFMPSISPSMDILISSNLERLLYDLSENDDKAVADLMSKLAADGRYTVSEKLKNKLTEQFFGEYCNDDETKETIKKVFEKYSYLVDTHTAVAVNVYEKYIKKTNDDTKTIIASTASPYKFSSSVLSAIDPSKLSDDEFEMVNILSKLTATEIPNSLAELKNKKVLHNQSCEKQNMKEFIFKKLGI